jgi:hydroxymethylpyrimidine pyrophosphatase-like HAD family hydrolase
LKLSLVAVDLDGTLLGGTSGRYGFLPAGVEALRQAVRKHSLVGIATGRDLPFILELLRREGIAPEKEGWPHVIIAEERYIYYLGKDGGYRPAADWNESIYQAELSQFRAIVHGVSALLSGDISTLPPVGWREK